MAGFIRRYPFVPGTEVITLIEGVIVIDLTPPGAIAGVGTGVAACVGEFADCTYATSVSSGGVVSTKIQPQEIFSGADLADKLGGFDETLGEFGVSMGNGFVELRNKTFRRLIGVPVNMASSNGVRYFRQLPTNFSATIPTPIVPVQGGTVIAGREFRSGIARLRIASRVQFTSLEPIATGVGGSTVVGASAATQVFNATGGFDWTTIVRPDGTLGAHKGDILVLGFNTAGVIGPTDVLAPYGTFRVASDPASGIAITVERLDGVNFAFAGQTPVPWRLHYASDADSAPVLVPGAAAPGGYAAADAGGYTKPTRPLTNAAGASVDGAWAAATQVTPAVVPAVPSGSSWDPLSGLAGRVMPGGGGGLTFTAAVQAINAVAASAIDALYATAFTALLADEDPTRDINLVWSARKSSTIRTGLKSLALQKSILSAGVVAVISPPLDQTVITTIGGDASPGVGATREERVIYDWPGVKTFVPEAVGFRLKTADVNTTIDGILDVTSDGWLVAVCSNLAPERNPGQAAQPVPTVMSPILGIQRGVTGLDMNSYIYLKSKGICAPRMDRKVGPIFQSGVTSSIIAGFKNINRRRFADFIEDTVSDALLPFCKLPVDANLRDGALGQVDEFLNTLLSPNNPSAQRISGYTLDDKSGNTPALSALGIYVIIGKVEMMPMADFIVFQAQVGNGVLDVTTT